MDGEETNWSESVEDLAHGGDTDKAISLLESIVSNLETQKKSSQSDLLKLSTLSSTWPNSTPQRASPLKPTRLNLVQYSSNRDLITLFRLNNWEAVADRAPDELFSTQCLPHVSNLSLKDTKVQTSKRRGRGTFSYRKQGLYSDQQSDGPAIDNLEDEVESHNSRDTEIRDLKYGTRHVLILADFLPSTKTTDLEKLLDDFKDRGVVIRWVNDTVALAVFRTPTIALEACNSLKCPFTVRVLDESDVLLSSIPPRDLEPPRQRPETSARAANRLIANVMGLKLPASSFGSKELRKQEEARRNRIVFRQNMRDDAWGE